MSRDKSANAPHRILSEHKINHYLLARHLGILQVANMTVANSITEGKTVQEISRSGQSETVLEKLKTAINQLSPGLRTVATDTFVGENQKILDNYKALVIKLFPNGSKRPNEFKKALMAIEKMVDPENEEDIFQYIASQNLLYETRMRLAEHPINAPLTHQEKLSALKSYASLIEELFPNPEVRPPKLAEAFEKITKMHRNHLTETFNTVVDLHQSFFEELEYANCMNETDFNQLFLKNENAIRDQYKLTDEGRLENHHLMELKKDPSVIKKWLRNYSIPELFQAIDRSVPQPINQEEKALIQKGLRDYYAVNADRIQEMLSTNRQYYTAAGGQPDTRYCREIKKDQAFNFLLLNLFSNTPLSASRHQLQSAIHEYRDLVFNFYPESVAQRTRAGKLLGNFNLQTLHRDYLASFSAGNEAIVSRGTPSPKYSKYEAHQLAINSAFLHVQDRDQLKEILKNYQLTILENFPDPSKTPPSINSAYQNLLVLEDKLNQTPPIADEYIKTALTRLARDNLEFLNQLTCEAKVNAIINSIATTDWSLGMGGGVPTRITDGNYPEVTKKLPRTLSDVINTIDEAKKNPPTDWKKLLQNVGVMLSEASQKTVLSRSSSTKKFYERTSQEIKRLLPTFSDEQRLLYHPMHHPNQVAPDQIKATIDDYKRLVNGVFGSGPEAKKYLSPEALDPLIHKLLENHDIHHPNRVKPGQIKATVESYKKLIDSIYPDNKAYAASHCKNAINKFTIQRLSEHNINLGVKMTGAPLLREESATSYFELLDELSALGYEPMQDSLEQLKEKAKQYSGGPRDKAYIFLSTTNRDFLAKQKLQSLLLEIRDTKWNCGWGGVKTKIGDQEVKLPATLAKVVNWIERGKDGEWTTILTNVEKALDQKSGTSSKPWSRHEDTQKFYNRMKGELKDIREGEQPEITPKPKLG